MSTRSLRRCLLVARALGVATLALLVATAFTPLPNVVARGLVTPDPLMPADAIVALSATILGDGTISDDSMRRFVRATELYAEGLAPLLVLSGGHSRLRGKEAEVRTALARRFGVPATAIVTVSDNQTTRDEALAVAAVLRPRAARRVLIVTDWAHAGRARATFERVGLDVRVAVTRRDPDTAGSPEERLWLAWECARELLARAYYRMMSFA